MTQADNSALISFAEFVLPVFSQFSVSLMRDGKHYCPIVDGSERRKLTWGSDRDTE